MKCNVNRIIQWMEKKRAGKWNSISWNDCKTLPFTFIIFFLFFSSQIHDVITLCSGFFISLNRNFSEDDHLLGILVVCKWLQLIFFLQFCWFLILRTPGLAFSINLLIWYHFILDLKQNKRYLIRHSMSMGVTAVQQRSDRIPVRRKFFFFLFWHCFSTLRNHNN